jgi:hypothetical protein
MMPSTWSAPVFALAGALIRRAPFIRRRAGDFGDELEATQGDARRLRQRRCAQMNVRSFLRRRASFHP